MGRPNKQHAVALTNYIFNVGYMGQQWADVQLTFFETALKLHRSELRAAQSVQAQADLPSHPVPQPLPLAVHRQHRSRHNGALEI